MDLFRPALGVVLTLLIEGLVFSLFGYRKKMAWLVFIFVNICTQGLLNFWLIRINNPLTWGNSEVMRNLTGELWVFVIEMAVFLILLKEHSRRRTVIYVISANLLSLLAGFFVFPLVLTYF